jgi:hypothetical protein
MMTGVPNKIRGRSAHAVSIRVRVKGRQVIPRIDPRTSVDNIKQRNTRFIGYSLGSRHDMKPKR